MNDHCIFDYRVSLSSGNKKKFIAASFDSNVAEGIVDVEKLSSSMETIEFYKTCRRKVPGPRGQKHGGNGGFWWSKLPPETFFSIFTHY